MDKIYSRRRIKLPKLKPKKASKFKIWFSIFFFIFLIGIGNYIYISYPIFVASCQTAAASKANHIVSEEVENVMNYYTYSDLIKVDKDESGKVVFMQTNTALVNQLISKIIKNIQTRIDNSPTTMVYINYGSVSRDINIKKFWT